MFQEQLLKFKNIKLYFVHFIPKSDNVKEFYKIGVTSKYDVADRFIDEEYLHWNIKVITTAYGPTLEVLAAEDELKLKYPKNLYIEQKIKGVTEIFMPIDHQEYEDVYNYVKEKSDLWYKQRNPEEPKYFVKKLEAPTV